MNKFRADVETLDTFLFKYLELMDYSSKLLISFCIVLYLYKMLIVLAFLQVWYLLRLRSKCISAVTDVI